MIKKTLLKRYTSVKIIACLYANEKDRVNRKKLMSPDKALLIIWNF